MIPRDQAIRNFRATLDAALDRIARDRAAGRLAPEVLAHIEQAEQAAAADRLRTAA
ncbi:hypothetical protein [Streptomyces sp. DT171]|uniref:hypothetical protein n=1 Tax=Streptomyces sp. DT171 TaxID=3416524 RepID=UPI003CF3BAB4